MALFAWLQKRIKYFLNWLGILEDETDSWDTLNTQYNKLNALVSGQSNLTEYDHTIFPLPIEDTVQLPHKFWHSNLTGSLYFPFVNDGKIFLQAYSYNEPAKTVNSVYTTEDFVNFIKITSIENVPLLTIYSLPDENFNNVISYGEYDYFQSVYVASSGGIVSANLKQRFRYSDFNYVIAQTSFFGNKIQFVNKSTTTIQGTSYTYNTWFINGSENTEIIFPSYNGILSGMYASSFKGDMQSCYNTLPNGGVLYDIGSSFTAVPYWQKYSMAGGVYLYICMNDLLYQYNTSYELQNIYHVPFPNFGMIYWSGKLYFIVREGFIKCNLS